MDTGLTIVAWATIVVGYALVLELLGVYRRAWSASKWLVGLPTRRRLRRQKELRQRLLRNMPPLGEPLYSGELGRDWTVQDLWNNAAGVARRNQELRNKSRAESLTTAAPPPTTEAPLTAPATRQLQADLLNLETAGVWALVPLPTDWERLSISLTDGGFSVSIEDGSMNTESPWTFGSMSVPEKVGR